MILATEIIITIVVVAASTLRLRGVCNLVKNLCLQDKKTILLSTTSRTKNYYLLLSIVFKFKCTFSLTILSNFYFGPCTLNQWFSSPILKISSIFSIYAFKVGFF
ncbi:hypothetical protein MtrunA17_Chr2g0283721 [Medicago truncatula]|uniref:Transmembrane protein, putative n=1 Tax=Medicago truncatula TaxID=3880 RepID=A0A072V400_MEDTR|nr:transmembrane protein, putative [Medicago truncatula]RHN72074.1 hypothetical protein MtrunA17_Chr2g0283721 [Medicago truncatula]